MFGRGPTFEELAVQLVVSEAVLMDVVAYENYLRVESVQGLLAEDEMEEEHAFTSVFGTRTRLLKRTCTNGCFRKPFSMHWNRS